MSETAGMAGFTQAWREQLRPAAAAFARGAGCVARKEFTGFFTSLAGVIFIGVFLALTQFVVFWAERFFARNLADVRPLFEWAPVILIFLVSALTMRMWSEEKRTGSVELLLTSSATPVQLVFGKAVAALALVAVALGLTLPLPMTVALIGPLDWGPVIGGYVAALALASAYIAIGLFVSARTESQVVALIGSVLICGVFYLIGSDVIVSLFGHEGGALLRALGSGSRFDSITRGVIDLRDLYYYVSVFGVFTVLTLYTLERDRWSTERARPRHTRWRLAAGLALANLIAGNLWLGQVSGARADLTEGRVYSISPTTRSYLSRLEEPLLIRGYFSAETHPLLAPLIPRLRDLLVEYELAGRGQVRVEMIDPAEEPALEEEAARRYGIEPVPFQTSTRYQASVTNSYFDLLIQYGDDFEVLGFRDLIEIKGGEGDLNVALRDPEYDITRAIRKTLASYRAGGDLFSGLSDPVSLEVYVSPDADLPAPLPALRADLEALIAEYEAEGGDRFTGVLQDPEADGGGVADSLEQAYGLGPLAAGLFDPQIFWFTILLRSGDRVIDVPLPADGAIDSARRAIEAELKRFTPGALRTIAFAAPEPTAPAFGGFAPPQGDAPQFNQVQARLRETAEVRAADLESGRVPDGADALIVAAPDALSETAVFAIDQFLMRGGAVIIAAGRSRPQLSQDFAMTPVETGLSDWLAHHGLALDASIVVDAQSAPFPVPVDRDLGGFTVREIQLVDYPPFVDVRSDGLPAEAGPTAGLEQLTVSWASPITVDAEAHGERAVTRLIESSPRAWTAQPLNGVPDYDAFPDLGFAQDGAPARRLLGVISEGRFTSYFADKPSPLARDPEPADPEPADPASAGGDGGEIAAEAEAEPAPITGVIDQSPESARLILIGSETFLSDDVLDLASSIDGVAYDAPAVLVENLVDWSLEDPELLALRGRGGVFSRTLAPLSGGERRFWEAANYGLAGLGLLAVYALSRRQRRASTRRLLDAIAAEGGTS